MSKHYVHLTEAERELVAKMHWEGKGPSAIARSICVFGVRHDMLLFINPPPRLLHLVFHLTPLPQVGRQL